MTKTQAPDHITASRAVVFSADGTAHQCAPNNFGRVYCGDSNSGQINILVGGRIAAVLLREIERDRDHRGKMVSRTTWLYVGPVRGEGGESEVLHRTLREAKAFAKEQLGGNE